jgi:methyl-accepting chemotaxis protein
MIASAEYMTGIDDAFWRMGVTAAKVIGVLLLCSIGIAWMVARSVVKPLADLKARMTSLSAGELDAPVAGEDRCDELGEMARAVLIFKEHMASEKRLAGEQEAERAPSEAAKRMALMKMADTVETESGTALRRIGIRTTAMAATADTVSASAALTGASAKDAAVAAGPSCRRRRSRRPSGRCRPACGYRIATPAHYWTPEPRRMTARPRRP